MINFRYKDRRTNIHRLNPFVKLAWVVSVFVLALIFNNPVYLLILLLSTIPLVIAAGVRKEWASLIKYTAIFSVLLITINTLLNANGAHPLRQAPFRIPLLGAPAITLEAFIFGAAMSLRLLAIMSAFTLLTFTIHPDDIMLVMIKLRLPYKSVLVTSLSTRFVPTLIDDAERISDVQRSRGLELDSGKLIQRARNRLAVIIPLLSNSLDRAVQVAEAMEARGFGSGDKRTFYKEITLSRPDIPALALAVLPMTLGALIRAWGLGDYQYFPALGRLSFSGSEIALISLLALSLIALVPLASLIKKRQVD